jgi:iron complex transport system substrate-binding protein
MRPSWTIVLCALLGSAAVHASPRRVVSQTVGTDELLLALADPGQIAALSRFARDPAFSVDAKQAAAYPKLERDDAESVIRFQPDLVLAASYTEPETLTLLRRAGVKLIVAEQFESLEDVYSNIRTLGAALGHSDRAGELIRTTRARVIDLARKLNGVKPVRIQDLCDHAGAINVAAEAGLVGHARTPDERLLTWNPEVLIASDNEGPDLVTRLRQVPAYKHLPALRAGRLVVLPGSLLASVTHYRVAAFEALARELHPERFR